MDKTDIDNKEEDRRHAKRLAIIGNAVKARNLEKAFMTAMDCCAEKGILADFLPQNKSKVWELLKNEYGVESENDEGEEEGSERSNALVALCMMAEGYSIEQIAEITKLTPEQLLELEQNKEDYSEDLAKLTDS